MTFLFGALAMLLLTVSLRAAPSWHHPLYLANNGCWPQRVAVTFVNESAENLAGEPVTVSLPALAGATVESLRVCREDGVELLYELQDAAGRSKRSGKLSASDTLRVPVECAAKSSTRVFVYVGNEQAWAVSDFLPPGFVNGACESGDQSPEGWQPAQNDDQHRLSWERMAGRKGTRCLKAEVSPGAPATWVQWQQSGLAVVPGRTYRLSGWVRAEGVVGTAGWYVHVNGERPQLINQTLNAGSGTFDWRQVSTSFTAPTNARTAIIGTVLHGTGRAWYDDFSWAEVGQPPSVRASVGELERLVLDHGGEVPAPSGPDWASWLEVRVRNLSDETASPALARVNLRPALARLPGLPRNPALRVAGPAGREIAAHQLGRGADLLFAADLPPRSERLFHIGLSPEPRPAGVPGDGEFEKLLTNSANLVGNASFERGSDAPEFWLKPATGIAAGFSTDAKFGRRSAEFTVPAGRRPDWIGWQSPPIPVKAGATYLLGAWLKAVGLGGTAAVHAHFHNLQGALTKSGAMVSTQPPVGSDAGWVNSLAFIHAPPDAATIRLHLTMNTHGTLRHDGVVLCQVLDGVIDQVHAPAPPPLAPEAPLHVWEVNPLVKVFPDTPPQAPPRAVSVELAQNEFEPFQLAVRARAGVAIGRVEVAVFSLTNARGAALPPVKVERVGYVPVDHPSGYFTTDVPDWCRKVPRGSGATDGWAGWWPDPLLPATPFAIPTNHTHPLWFTLRAPAGAAPGEYRGRIQLLADNSPPFALPLTVRVLPFELPQRTRLKAVFDFRRGPGGWHGPDATSPAEHRKWLQLMADHRLGIDAIEPAPRFFYQNGKVTMDTAGFDETARLCFDELGMNVCYTPWFFYMFGWAYPPKKIFGYEPFTPEWTAAFQQAYRLFSDHLRAKGWHDKFVYYISDEPHFDREFVVQQMQKLCAMIHEVDPRIPIYSSTWRHCAAWDQSLDLWGVGQYGCFPVAEMERLKKAGRKMWFTCDGQMATDTPYLATERMLPYYCFRYGVEGFEFWGLSWWTYDPWEKGWHTFIRQSDDGTRHYWIRYPNGDGFLAYPGKAVGVDGPVSTIRLEQVREGLEDYEALSLLTERIQRAGGPFPMAEKALAMARELVSIPNAGGLRSADILPEPDRLPAIRRAVNAAIVALGTDARPPSANPK